MIDIHSHIIFDVDDGSESLDESLKMIEEAKSVGVKTIIATPHFMNHVLDPDRTTNNFRALIDKVSGLGVDIKMGYEVVLNPLLLQGIRIVEQHTLNNSDYILVEFPFSSSFELSRNVLEQIQQKGLIPIIAHPERIETFMKKRRLIRDIKDKGCLLQVNAGSIEGYYGEKTRAVAKHIIEEKLADFVASDAHRPRYYDRYRRAFHKVAKWTDEEYAHKLFHINAQVLL